MASLCNPRQTARLCDEYHCAILPQRSQVLHFPLITISQQTVHSGSFLLVLQYLYWMQRRHQRGNSLHWLLLDVAHVKSTETFTHVFPNCQLSPEPVQCVQTSVQGGLLWLQHGGWSQETAWKGWGDQWLHLYFSTSMCGLLGAWRSCCGLILQVSEGRNCYQSAIKQNWPVCKKRKAWLLCFDLPLSTKKSIEP